MPPPYHGGISMAIMVNILSENDLGEVGWHSPRPLHPQVEAMGGAFAVRNHFLGDPNYVEIPRKWLSSDDYAG